MSLEHPITVDFELHTVEKECKFCGSEDLQHKIEYFTMCNNCGKHTLLGERFHFLEIDRNKIYIKDEVLGNILNTPEITVQVLKSIVEEISEKYSEENKIEGSRFYYVKKIIEGLKI